LALDNAAKAYAVVGGADLSIGILLAYPSPVEQPETALR